jgi:hypothetical protein
VFACSFESEGGTVTLKASPSSGELTFSARRARSAERTLRSVFPAESTPLISGDLDLHCRLMTMKIHHNMKTPALESLIDFETATLNFGALPLVDDMS